MSVLLVCTPEESYATPFLQNSQDEVVVDTSGGFTGTADRVVVTGVAAQPAALRAAIDAASAFAGGTVEIGPLVGSPSNDRSAWTEALTGLRLAKITTERGVPVAHVTTDSKAAGVEAAVLLGALIALPESTVVPAAPAPAPAATPVAAKKAAASTKPAPRQSLPKRVLKLVRSRRKLVFALGVVALVALALGAAAYAVVGGYYVAVVATAILGVVTLSALRTEQQNRRLLSGDLVFQTKQAARAAVHYKRLARSLGVIELTTADIQDKLARKDDKQA